MNKCSEHKISIVHVCMGVYICNQCRVPKKKTFDSCECAGCQVIILTIDLLRVVCVCDIFAQSFARGREQLWQSPPRCPVENQREALARGAAWCKRRTHIHTNTSVHVHTYTHTCAHIHIGLPSPLLSLPQGGRVRPYICPIENQTGRKRWRVARGFT